MQKIFQLLIVLLLSSVPGTAETIEVDLPYQEFISAACNGDSAAVNRMLGERYDYRAAVLKNGNISPLMGAAANGQMGMLRFFLNRGDEVNALSSFNGTAFTGAVWNEHYPEAETLLARGADPTLGIVGNWKPALVDCYNSMYSDPGRRPFLNLMVASVPKERAKAGLSPALPTVLDHEDVDYARRLVEAGADVEYRMTGTKPYEGFTPLIFASAKGLPDMVRMLLDHGANANAADTNGVTSLMHAIANMRWNAAEDIERRYQEVINQLLAAKPGLALKATLLLLNTPTGNGTALEMARLYLNNERGTPGSPVKKDILASIEAAYHAAGLLKPLKPAAKATAEKKKTVKKLPAVKKVNRLVAPEQPSSMILNSAIKRPDWNSNRVFLLWEIYCRVPLVASVIRLPFWLVTDTRTDALPALAAVVSVLDRVKWNTVVPLPGYRLSGTVNDVGSRVALPVPTRDRPMVVPPTKGMPKSSLTVKVNEPEVLFSILNVLGTTETIEVGPESSTLQ